MFTKKLIEVALPLEAINAACIEDKDRKTGHIRNLHKWFAPMPLPAWRAILFASLVDDPANTLPADLAERERQRLLQLIERLVPFEAVHDKEAWNRAKAEIVRSLGDDLPTLVDPFCGGGSTIVEAQRLGLASIASDLNQIPVLITSMLCSIPPRVVDRKPVNPQDRSQVLKTWPGLSGFIADVKYYAARMRDRAWIELRHLYPPAPGGGTVMAWRWARTVASPNPRVKGAHTPLVGDWWMCKTRGNEAWIEPVIDHATNAVSFAIRTTGSPPKGTTSRAGARCLLTGSPIPLDHIREEGKAGRLRMAMIGMAAESRGVRRFLPPDPNHIAAADRAVPAWKPDLDLPARALGFRALPAF